MRAAEGLLALAPPSVDLAAFHCQQAVEKMLKGLLVATRRKAMKTHNLDMLATAVVRAFPALEDDLGPFRPLTPWFVATRYPDIDVEPRPTVEEVDLTLQRLRALRGRAAALDPTEVSPRRRRGRQDNRGH